MAGRCDYGEHRRTRGVVCVIIGDSNSYMYTCTYTYAYRHMHMCVGTRVYTWTCAQQTPLGYTRQINEIANFRSLL